MARSRNAARRARLALVTFACLAVASPAVLGGDLEPTGPPAPTMRTLESLGFDCPNDPVDTTNLLFPYVVNQFGFDTVLVISNTGHDPFGHTGKAGKCTLTFYGDRAPSLLDTPTISAGTTWTALTSSVAPAFQGYMIAICHFPLAHGFAFLGDAGFSSISTGYLPSVICSDRGANVSGAGR